MAALEADESLIAKFLEGTEAVAVVILLSVFTRSLATPAAGDVYVLQVLCAGCHECGIVGCLFLHVPEVAHTLHAFAVSVACDGSCVGYEAHVEAFATVQGFKDDGCAALEGELAELVELFAEVVACVHCVRSAGLLSVEGRHHDDAAGVNLSCSLDDFAHCAVEGILLFVFGEDESVEAGTDGSHPYIASLEGVVYLIHATGQSASADLEACHAQAFAVVELFLKVIAQGEYIASSLQEYLHRHPEMADKCTRDGTCRYLTTENNIIFDHSACRFMQHDVQSQHIELTY